MVVRAVTNLPAAGLGAPEPEALRARTLRGRSKSSMDMARVRAMRFKWCMGSDDTADQHQSQRTLQHARAGVNHKNHSQKH